MLTWDDVNTKLQKLPNEYNKLNKIFGDAISDIPNRFAAATFQIKEISALIHQKPQRLEVIFAGCTIIFSFTTYLDQNILRGRITCHLTPRFGELEITKLGEFTFNGNGITDLESPEQPGLKLSLKDDIDALHIILDFVYKAFE